MSSVGKSSHDLDDHGTHCASIAAGHVSHSHGFRYDVAPQAQLFVARVLKNNGEGEDNFVLAGIEWALENKCKVISMSLGSAVNCPSILSVSAVDHLYRVADFSCGGSHKKDNHVNITAPGVDTINCTKRGKYDVLSGTPMATPFVAGMAALLWEKYPNVTGDAIWKKLIDGPRGVDLRSSDAGAGIVFVS